MNQSKLVFAVRKNDHTEFVGTKAQIRERFSQLLKMEPSMFAAETLAKAGYEIVAVNPLAVEIHEPLHKPLTEQVKLFPTKPGVYLFKDAQGRVLYVGKAKNLKSRISQYFDGHDTRVQLPFLRAEAVEVDYIVTPTEVESLFLENTLIKQYLPPYNIRLKDDKQYAFISIDRQTEIPQLRITRQPILQTKLGRSFGPYSSAKKARRTLEIIRQIFPYCGHKEVSTRPCFYYYLHRCPGVCIGKIDLTEYEKTLGLLSEFLSGKIKATEKDLRAQMLTAAQTKLFERAASLRDQLSALTVLTERQAAVMQSEVSWDFIATALTATQAAVSLVKVREGRITDTETFWYTHPEISNADEAKAAVTRQFTQNYYADTSDWPQEIHFLTSDAERDNYIAELASKRLQRRVHIVVPERGDRIRLMEMANENANDQLRRWQHESLDNPALRRATLESLQEILQLPTLPIRIECYDNSNTQGTNPVGAMVVFEDGQPSKGQYRKFKIRGMDTPDDFATMKQVLTRRLSRSLIHPNELTETNQELENPWPLPDLFVIDGGKGQLSAVMEVMHEFEIHIPVIGLAKKLEEIFRPDSDVPIVLPHSNPALQLLQRLRDEAHRFGITFHRQLRTKTGMKSQLDTIPGVGPQTKKLLKKHFGTVATIRRTSVDELAKIIGPAKAAIVLAALN